MKETRMYTVIMLILSIALVGCCVEKEVDTSMTICFEPGSDMTEWKAKAQESDHCYIEEINQSLCYTCTKLTVKQGFC